MKLVEFSREDMFYLATRGIVRQLDAMELGLEDKPRSALKDHFTNNIFGVFGEAAYARAVGKEYVFRTKTYKSQSDVGDRTEVRCRTKESYELKVTKEDPIDQEYVLVTWVEGTWKFKVWGSIEGRDAKLDKYWHDLPNGLGFAYWIPKKDLKPIE